MVTIHITRTTTVPPGRVTAALTDFSDRRFEIFASIDRRHFSVHQVGPTSAEVTEGASFLGGDLGADPLRLVDTGRGQP